MDEMKGGNTVEMAVHAAPSSENKNDNNHVETKPATRGIVYIIDRFKLGFITFLKELMSKESLKFLGIAILVIAVSIAIAFILGQASYGFLVSNASNAGHLYGIITSAIAFFFFARYLRRKKDIYYVRRFIVLYFIVYFAIVMLILAFLQGNVVYLLSTLGNSFILFSAYTLIIFIISPEILGVQGSGGGFRKLFLSGQHVRVIVVYLFIALMQVFGFSLLNYAIQLYSIPGDPAYTGTVGGWPGSWFDFFYYSTITFATIGYGDIHPALPIAELSSTIQALLSHVLSILFLAVLLLYLSSSTSTTTDVARESE
ncbi:MAG: two pore domain potassium channel family protein [Candidatus Lokiarchaeota archaeon]|nr:two pore domain potassium channel family protein [Candidatus Lokiarchaeota archaeon]